MNKFSTNNFSKSNNSNYFNHIISSKFQNGGNKRLKENRNNFIIEENNNSNNIDVINKKGQSRIASFTPVITPDSIFRHSGNVNRKTITQTKSKFNNFSQKKMKKTQPQTFESEIELDENFISTNNNDNNKDNNNNNNSNINNNNINIKKNQSNKNKSDNEKDNGNPNRKVYNSNNNITMNKNVKIKEDNKGINIQKYNLNDNNNNNYNKNSNLIIKEKENKSELKIIKISNNQEEENIKKKYNTNEESNPSFFNYEFNKNYNIKGRRISLNDNIEIFNPLNVNRSFSYKNTFNCKNALNKKIEELNNKENEHKLQSFNFPKEKTIIPNGHSLSFNEISKIEKLKKENNNISYKENYQLNKRNNILVKQPQKKFNNIFIGNNRMNKNKNFGKEIFFDDNEIVSSDIKSYNLKSKFFTENLNKKNLRKNNNKDKEKFKNGDNYEYKYKSEEIKINGMYKNNILDDYYISETYKTEETKNIDNLNDEIEKLKKKENEVKQ